MLHRLSLIIILHSRFVSTDKNTADIYKLLYFYDYFILCMSHFVNYIHTTCFTHLHLLRHWLHMHFYNKRMTTSHKYLAYTCTYLSVLRHVSPLPSHSTIPHLHSHPHHRCYSRWYRYGLLCSSQWFSMWCTTCSLEGKVYGVFCCRGMVS